MNRLYYLMTGLFLMANAACKKQDNSHGGNTNGFNGNLYFSWATEGTLKMNLASGEKTVFLSPDSRQNGFDISRDQKKVLVLSDIAGDYDNEEFKILEAGSGALLKSKKISIGNFSYSNPRFSYDATFIMTNTLLPGKAIVIDISQDKTYVLNDVHGKEILEAVWTPDGDILLCAGNTLYRTKVPFTDVTTVKEFDFENWGQVAISPDGKKIALKGDDHIWLMNADGTGLKQITNSSTEEGAATFSPNSQYLLVGVHQFSSGGGPWGGYYTMYILPADGNQYTIEEEKNSDKVTMVIPKDGNSVQAYDRYILWL